MVSGPSLLGLRVSMIIHSELRLDAIQLAGEVNWCGHTGKRLDTQLGGTQANKHTERTETQKYQHKCEQVLIDTDRLK